MCLRECAYVFESVYVFEKESICVQERERERERESVCVCVCFMEMKSSIP